MTTQITIIGLGQMGGSIGLALAPHKQTLVRTGHDKRMDVARAAQTAGAVDSIHFNLPAAASNADAVILALPLNEVRDTLKFIRDDLKEGAVVMDLSPAKRQVEAWARETLPPGRFYVGLAPAVNPARLLDLGGGLDAARADLLADATVLVCPSAGAPEGAVRFATDLVRLLGAASLISDSAEADGLLAATTFLPRWLAVSLVEATMTQPGWRDARNLAHRSYAMPIAASFDRDDADGFNEATLANRENVTRVLDNAIESLRALRDRIENGDRAALDERARAAQSRANEWLAERRLESYRPAQTKKTDDAMDDSSLGGRLRRMFVGRWRLPGADREGK